MVSGTPRVKIAKGSFDFNDFLWNPGSVANQMVKVGSSMFSRFHDIGRCINITAETSEHVNEIWLVSERGAPVACNRGMGRKGYCMRRPAPKKVSSRCLCRLLSRVKVTQVLPEEDVRSVFKSTFIVHVWVQVLSRKRLTIDLYTGLRTASQKNVWAQVLPQDVFKSMWVQVYVLHVSPTD